MRGALELPAARWHFLNERCPQLLVLLQTLGGVAGSLELFTLITVTESKNTQVCALSTSFANSLSGSPAGRCVLENRAGAAGTANSR